MHWHGLRLEPIRRHARHAGADPRETFTYEVSVPDPGAYWYHPHIREDYGQEMGLYGNILVVPASRTTGRLRTASCSHARRHPDRGREDRGLPGIRDDPRRDGSLRQRDARRRRARSRTDCVRGEVVRLYLTNTANTRASSTSRCRAPE